VGSNDGLVHVTRDAGATWTDVTAAMKLVPWGKISAIEPSHFDAGTAYLAVDLHELDDLGPYIYKTADFGKTWTNIAGTLPRSTMSFVHNVAEDPSRKGMLFAGTENGLYVTLDDGAHWAALQTNLPHAPVSWIVVQPKFKDLVVATYGRGLWILDDITPLEQMDPGASRARPISSPRARPIASAARRASPTRPTAPSTRKTRPTALVSRTTCRPPSPTPARRPTPRAASGRFASRSWAPKAIPCASSTASGSPA